MIKATYDSSVAALMSQIQNQRQQISPVDDFAPKATNIQGANASQKVDYASVAKDALDAVDESQKTSSALKSAYERGEDVPLTSVVLAMQKSSLAFEATLQVRNKVLKAYQDILNMPV
jgi:flagellar hook-basal body complex protein FliE